ncbi:sulfotransferase domain-containing protein [bacterium]|nr:sulfotransferase domain-containing protein [bacterium]
MFDIGNVCPNLFIIGAPKCGTSAFVDGLAQHDEIHVQIKEPRFFDAHTYYDFESDYPFDDLEQYKRLYQSIEADQYKYRVDASVFNMYSEKSLINIKNFSGNAKFIVILRNPVEAAKSMHRQRLMYLEKPMREVSDDFCECWRTLNDRKQGHAYPEGCRNKFIFRYDLMYSYQLYIDSMVSIVGRENILFIDYTDYKSNPQKIFDMVFTFLAVGNIKILNNIVNPSYYIEKKFF